MPNLASESSGAPVRRRARDRSFGTVWHWSVGPLGWQPLSNRRASSPIVRSGDELALTRRWRRAVTWGTWVGVALCAAWFFCCALIVIVALADTTSPASKRALWLVAGVLLGAIPALTVLYGLGQGVWASEGEITVRNSFRRFTIKQTDTTGVAVRPHSGREGTTWKVVVTTTGGRDVVLDALRSDDPADLEEAYADICRSLGVRRERWAAD
jgi:hypothetical protein